MLNFYSKKIHIISIGISLLLLLGGCNLSPTKKPNTGPTGNPVEEKQNPPLLERFSSAPVQIYDMETTGGTVFYGIIHENWQQAECGLADLKILWQETKMSTVNKNSIKSGDEALEKLSASIAGKDQTACHEYLNQFMASIVDIGKSYKLSPASDIVSIGNVIRSVSFFVEDRNWPKASAKAKEVEDTWSHIKPSLEQIGVLSEVTITHSLIKQLHDAVRAENKNAADEKLSDLNKTLGQIREYYRGK